MANDRLTAESLRAIHAGGVSSDTSLENSAARPSLQVERPMSAEAERYAPNKYPGKCDRCGERVEAGAGLRMSRGGSWIVFHPQGSCPEAPLLPSEGVPHASGQAPAKANVSRETSRENPAPFKVTTPVPDGYYTVVWNEDDSYLTLRVRMQREDASFMPGAQIVAYLSGPDNESSYTNFGAISDGAFKVWRKHSGNESAIEAVKVLIGDPIAALRAYGLRTKQCGICNRKLSTPESIFYGIGPECRKKAAW